MKKNSLNRSLLIIALFGVCVGVVVFVLLLFSARTFNIYMRESADGYSDVKAEYSEPGIVEMIDAKKQGDVWVVTFRALKRGETSVSVLFSHKNMEYQDLTDAYHTAMYVTRFGTILQPSELDFNGFHIMCVGFLLLFLFAGVYLFLQYRRRKKLAFFSYETVLNLGLSLLFLLHAMIFFGVDIFCRLRPDEATGRLLFFAMEYAMTAMVLVAFPLVLLLAVSMAISNVWLIRHEGLRKTNLLALFLAVLLTGGVGVCLLAGFVNTQLFAFDPRSVWISSARTVISAVFLYFACVLLATQYCCVIAAHRNPPLQQDYVLILGCAIKKDGSLYPLIKGRADKAIEFYHRQKESTGVAPVLVPSGGQGSDEVMAEGEAVRRYLLSQGIPESDILAETKSANTLENMRFSKALIDARTPNANVIFSTTNYHVFRSGILAGDVGLKTDGIAGKTKWYFWPNAQIREFVGLLVRNWKLHLLMLVLLVVFSLLLSNANSILSFLIS